VSGADLKFFSVRFLKAVQACARLGQNSLTANAVKIFLDAPAAAIAGQSGYLEPLPP